MVIKMSTCIQLVQLDRTKYSKLESFVTIGNPYRIGLQRKLNLISFYGRNVWGGYLGIKSLFSQ